jgi:hypothetical protein
MCPIEINFAFVEPTVLSGATASRSREALMAARKDKPRDFLTSRNRPDLYSRRRLSKHVFGVGGAAR